MKTKLLYSVWFVCCALAGWLLYRSWDGESSGLTPIYNETANASTQVDDALALAKRENRLVLLQFGANWCIWCHRLHDLFETDRAIAKELKSNYVVVLVDVNQDHNQDVVEKYGKPTQFGLPVIVILDANGKQLTTQNTADLVDPSLQHHDPQKVLSFLQKWTFRK